MRHSGRWENLLYPASTARGGDARILAQLFRLSATSAGNGPIQMLLSCLVTPDHFLLKTIVDEAQFWQLIEATKPFGPYTIEAHYDRLLERICSLTEPEIREFAKVFHAQLENANRWEVWDAAYVINTGCGDDSFEDFKAGLIAQGENVLQTALEAPESLAQYPYAEQLIRGESILFLPFTAYQLKVYGTYDYDSSQEFPTEVLPRGRGEPSGATVGEESEALQKRFPQLFAAFWDLEEYSAERVRKRLGRGRRTSLSQADGDKFWQLVERSRPFAPYTIQAHYDRLLETVSGLTEPEILSFARVFNALMQKAHRWELWDAAYVINTGCDHDSFEAFKAGLILQGQELFEAIVESPESWGGFIGVRDLAHFGAVRFLPWTSYRIKLLGLPPDDSSSSYPSEVLPGSCGEPSGHSVGDDIEALKQRFPKLLGFWYIPEFISE